MGYCMNEPRIPVNNYEEQVKRYEEKPAEPGKIVFYGSSFFTRWSEKWGHRNLEDDIRGKDGSSIAVNHGFGGSTVEEQLYYYPRLVAAWKPKAMVFSGFLNDTWRGYSSQEVTFLFNRLLEYARRDVPGIRLYVTDIHPCASHIGKPVTYWDHYHADIQHYVEEYCEAHEDTTLISWLTCPYFFNRPEDVGQWEKMRTDLFVEDGVHFTQEGYDLAARFFREALDREL